MTDFSGRPTSLPTRLNAARVKVGDDWVFRLAPTAVMCRMGAVRASVYSYLIDVAAGIAVDDDPGMWTFTSDMTVRARPGPAPATVEAAATILRRGGRSSTCEVHVVDDQGSPVAYGILGFARVPRRPGDPEKWTSDPNLGSRFWEPAPPVEVPLPEAAGIRVVDGPAGVVEVEIVDELRNPAGTIQGAMAALVAEVAAEEMLSARHGGPVLVADLDIRYLAQARVGPVRTRGIWLGDGPDAGVLVELHDVTTGRFVTHVLARAEPG